MTQPYIVGDSSPFLKRVLIPFWVIRILIMVLEIILYAAAVAYTSANQDELDDAGIPKSTANSVIAILAVLLVIIAGCLTLDIICIVKRSRRTLSPRFFLITNVIQTTVWLVLFILTLIGVGNAITFIVAVAIFASFLGLLIYSSVIYHRFRKGTLRGNYAPANQASAYNQPSTYDQPAAHSQPATYSQPTAYTGAYAPNDPTKPYDANAPRYEMDNRYA